MDKEQPAPFPRTQAKIGRPEPPGQGAWTRIPGAYQRGRHVRPVLEGRGWSSVGVLTQPGNVRASFGIDTASIDDNKNPEWMRTEGESEGPPIESMSTSGGRLVVQHLPLLRRHVGTPPDLVLGWNAMRNPGQVDVVVHLHGYSPRGRAMQLPRDMVPVSGLDFADPSHRAALGRRVPTLTVLPRGNFFGGRSRRGYNHPALHARGALARLVGDALARFGAHTGIQAARGRLILTAHSGGGASLMRVLAYADPDEVHTFDALYTDPAPLIAWARARITRNDGGALRVLYREHEGTAAHSRTVRQALRRALAAHPATGPARFRVEVTPVPHMQIPPHFGWRLLADAGADLPDVQPVPSLPAWPRTSPWR